MHNTEGVIKPYFMQNRQDLPVVNPLQIYFYTIILDFQQSLFNITRKIDIRQR